MKKRLRVLESSAKKTKSVHPVDIANADLPPELAKSRYGKWRAFSLIMVYVLMIVHILHWKVAGKTMAPVELSEIMKALEMRVLSAGVIFMGIMLIGSLIFGRFFCSWGCHMLALQDLSHWILKKLRIRPKPIRSRVLLLVPLGAACYMFLWPQLNRMWLGYSLPNASSRLTTTDFWRDLPGPLVITLTALTCGFVVIYFFGGRGFCTYGCPYGVLFGVLDRLAPGKIRVGPGCEQCGKCTAICTSNIRVHEEVKAYGMVIDPRCMKDMDCVSVCPQDVLHFGFGRPSLARSWKTKAPARRYDFSIPEEIALVAVFLGALFTWRGLYDRLPFLMSLALSGVTAYLAITLARLFYRPHLTLNRYRLKIGGKLLKSGYVFAVACSVFMAFTAHSAYIQYHKIRGAALISSAEHPSAPGADARKGQFATLEAGVDHLLKCDRYGLASTTKLEMQLGRSLLTLGRPDEAEPYLRRAVERQPNYPDARTQLAGVLTKQGRLQEADGHLVYALGITSPHEEYQQDFQRIYVNAHVQRGNLLLQGGRIDLADEEFREALATEPEKLEAHFGLGMIAAQSGRLADAEVHYRKAIELHPNAAEAHANLGDVLLATGDAPGAMNAYRNALAANPELERGHFKLGVLSLHTAKVDEALQHFAIAVERSPNDSETRNYYGQALLEAGRMEEAQTQFERAVTLDERFADAHFNLGRLFASTGQRTAADKHLRRAVELDGRYSDLLRSVAPSGQ